MLSKDTRFYLNILCLLICICFGIALFGDDDEKLDPNSVLAVGVLVYTIPLTLLISAIRSIVRRQAVVERVLDVQDLGTQIITTYYVEIVHGPEAVSLGWQRTIFPVVCFVIWMVTLALKSDWSIPLRW